jgi:TRAP-type C4-dicarboxylate transport system permease small subunit
MTVKQDPHQDGERAILHRPDLPETWVEKTCGYLTAIAIIVMLLVITVDIITRSFLHFSFEISDEVASYALVAITFLSFSLCQVNHSFHHVELIQAKLSRTGQILSRIFFDILMLAACGLLVWQYWRLGVASWRFGGVAPTRLMTPLWLPQSLMTLGMVALTYSVFRTFVADVRMLHTKPDPEENSGS